MINKIINNNIFMLSFFIVFMMVLPKASSAWLIIFVVIPSLVCIKKEGYKKTGFEIPIMFFMVVCLLSIIGKESDIIKFSFHELIKAIKFLILLLLVPQLNIDLKKENIGILNKFIGIGIVLYDIILFFSFKGKYIVYNYIYYQRYTGGYQLSSYSGTLMIIILYMLRYLFEKKRNIEKIIFLNALILLIITQSRGAWLGTGIACLCYIIIEKRKESLKILLMVLFIFILIFSIKTPIVCRYTDRIRSIVNIKTDGSNTARLAMWKKSIPVFLSSPIKGVGYRTGGKHINLSASDNGIVHCHNFIIEMLTGTGILGVVSYFFIYFNMLKSIIKSKKSGFKVGLNMLYPLIGVFIYDNFEPIWIRGYAYHILLSLVCLTVIYNIKIEERGIDFWKK